MVRVTILGLCESDLIVFACLRLRQRRRQSPRLEDGLADYHRGRVGAARKVDDPARSAVGATTWSFP